MSTGALESLVEMRGIETQYVDAWGKPAKVNDATKAKLLKVMGYDTESEEAMQEQIHERFAGAWMTPLEPVQVNRVNAAINIVVRLPIELVNDTHQFIVALEDGTEMRQQFTPVDCEMLDATTVDDVEFHAYSVALTLDIPLGYHQVSLAAQDDQPFAQMRLIQAPNRCFTPPDIAQGKKVWGLSVQLYCLRSEANWGIGDFSDLTYLIEKSAAQGADFIGLNPIHALYPSNPDACSPYGPSSRRWLNYLYIDPKQIDGFNHESVQSLISNSGFQQQLKHVRDIDYIDYEAVAKLKLSALSRIFDVFNQKYLTKNTRFNKAFKQFVVEGGDSLQCLATFDAMQEHLQAEGKPSWGWPVFPAQFADFDSPAVSKFKKQHAKRIKFYLFLQWQASIQFEQASQKASDLGMTIGLYRDLAVGVSEGSAEIWGNKSLYCTEASVGAPPDILGPNGQNWGLPPMDPEKLYAQAYQPIIDLFSSNMHASGALRIDHAMALLRLWWIQKGDDAKEGGYVYYPVDDLLGILALESQRHQSLVIGEDLGTVPDEIRGKLADNGIYSYRVFFFEQAEDGGFFSPSHYPEQSMSTLTTHDMPTLIGYWHCDDLSLGKSLGLYRDEQVLQTLYDSRHSNKQEILNTLHGHQSVDHHVGRDVNHTPMTQALNFGLQTHMAAGSSALLSLQLEDWLQMDKPVNIPGTFNEYPNWKRKLSRTLSSVFDDPEVQGLASRIDSARKRVSQSGREGE
ncbi:4-alpha-glucanotransferase [Alteromonas oceanisediminis]|uniref:4-alpha-glucanotransferase n=1 Tax=Alteromonas oceanisediminis TaxID=2836180 RepID=UPI001BDABD7E|nr:4-alpha-glucanotransferase [Alteromonas oceanisediminis]MBT0586555.1 4-alpha-glucanotransferase [Alteromonas oceanisediminis]